MAIRPRIQRCFLTWLEEARPRLSVQPRVARRNDSHLDMSFDGLTPAIGAILSRYDIDVWVEWRGIPWDLVYSEYIDVSGRRGSYFCAACPPEQQVAFPTREALWREHLFEIFLDWVNKRLAPASHLVLYGSDDWEQGSPGWSAARLWRPGDDPQIIEKAFAMLPLREGPNGTDPVP